MRLTKIESVELVTLLQDEIENLGYMKDQKGVDNNLLQKKIGVLSTVLSKTRGTFEYSLEDNLV